MKCFRKVIQKIKDRRVKQEIISYCKEINDKSAKDIVKYLKNNELTYFNYDWFKEYNSRLEYEIFSDENGRFYILYKNHRMYFKKDWSRERIYEYLDNLIPEQYEQSPHCYFAVGEKNSHYKNVIDAGVAEGLFGLEVIDITDKLYLIECDPEWVEALELTFAPYREKVVILSKFLGKVNSDEECNLDSLIDENDGIDLIKLDIEGGELNVLKATRNLHKVKQMLICVYHYQDEEMDVCKFFKEVKSFKTDILIRKGFIYFLHDQNQKYPYVRHGVVKVSVRELDV